MKQAISWILIVSLMFAALAGCGGPQASGPAQVNGGGISDTESTVQSASDPGGGWEDLFTYDEANAVQFTVKAAVPGEEDAYVYPWGGYDDPVGTPEESETNAGAGTNGSPEADAINDQLQQALQDLPPELRAQAEAAMQAAQAQREGAAAAPQQTPELPADWNAPSNQPALGGRLELVSGDATVIIELSEYCVDADTTFTVASVKTTALPEDFFKGGFSLSRGGETHVALNDYAVITFLITNDPGEDVVIKSFGKNGEMEYSLAEVTQLGDTYRITGVVEHFSTVGYGKIFPIPPLTPVNEQTRQELMEKQRQQEEELAKQKEAEQNRKKINRLQTIEFDEILYTTSAAGLPLQLHLRAKLVERAKSTQSGLASLMEREFTGKIWLKFYTWGPGGYGDLYMVCNDVTISDPATTSSASWIPLDKKVSSTATFQMTTVDGSKAVAEGVGTAGLSGKTYTNVQTIWVVDSATGKVQVTFTSLQGAADKTFITGMLSEKSERQANKKLKWFLN